MSTTPAINFIAIMAKPEKIMMKNNIRSRLMKKNLQEKLFANKVYI